MESSWIRKLNIAKMTILSKVIHRFNIIPYPNLNTFFEEMKMVILQFMWKFKGPRITKHTLKSTRLENSYFPIQNFCQSYSNQDSVYWRMVGHIV